MLYTRYRKRKRLFQIMNNYNKKIIDANNKGKLSTNPNVFIVVKINRNEIKQTCTIFCCFCYCANFQTYLMVYTLLKF